MENMIKAAGEAMAKTAATWNFEKRKGESGDRANDTFMTQRSLLTAMGFTVEALSGENGLVTGIVVNGQEFKVSDMGSWF